MSQPHTEAGSPQPAHPVNRLGAETSPYLLQHAHNPVNWYPWGQEAIDRAKAEDRPIFLSIGYSACHWCHVMERESFEKPEIAALMNEHFVNVKVDREERPDLDQIYMNAIQAMTGHGGWPMSVFLTPELKPFYGGTYFPPDDARGMPGFPRILMSVHHAWMERRDEILAAAGDMTERLRALGDFAAPPPSDERQLGLRHLDHAARNLLRSLDPVHGGFGQAPKFPHPMDLRVLLRQAGRTGDEQSLEAVELTLGKMARGGIYDHLGGGFARYSTDATWLVPHFEKMLYDNALLTSTYLEAFQLTGDPEYARVARETIEYVLGRMTVPEGAFASTEDADSEGEEGKYYVWSWDEVNATLGADRAKAFSYVYDISAMGNWEGHNILNMPKSLAQSARMLGREEADLAVELAEDRARLLSVRERRVPPGKDTKVLVSWNGLMLAALSVAGRALREPRYLDAASRAAAFILDRMRGEGGKLLHTYKDGRARLNAYLDDYANLIDGLSRLYEATGEPRWVEEAIELARIMIEEFADAEDGGFYYTGISHEALIARPKDLIDNATPSGNGVAATALLRLGALTGRGDLTATARKALAVVQPLLEEAPSAAGQSLIALDLDLASGREIAVIAGSEPDEFREVLEAIQARFLPHAVIAPASGEQAARLGSTLPLLTDRTARDGRTTVYVCTNHTCSEPVIGLAGLVGAIEQGASRSIS